MRFMKKACSRFFIAGIIILTLSDNIFGFQNESKIQDSTAIPKDWFLRDSETDRLQGLSIEKAYTLLEGRPSRTVIVAVIDTGVDFNHEDLKDVMWVNQKEIADNGYNYSTRRPTF